MGLFEWSIVAAFLFAVIYIGVYFRKDIKNAE